MTSEKHRAWRVRALGLPGSASWAVRWEGSLGCGQLSGQTWRWTSAGLRGRDDDPDLGPGCPPRALSPPEGPVSP